MTALKKQLERSIVFTTSKFELPMFDCIQGRIQDFKLGGAHLKKLRWAEGGANFFGVFRVKNHDFTPKNRIFYNFRPPPLVYILDDVHHLNLQTNFLFQSCCKLCFNLYGRSVTFVKHEVCICIFILHNQWWGCTLQQKEKVQFLHAAVHANKNTLVLTGGILFVKIWTFFINVIQHSLK